MKLRVFVEKLKYRNSSMNAKLIFFLKVMPVFEAAMKNRGNISTTTVPHATLAMPSRILGLALTMNLPRKSKRLPVGLKSIGNSSPVAEECCRIRYVGMTTTADIAPAIAEPKANLPALAKNEPTVNLSSGINAKYMTTEKNTRNMQTMYPE